MAEQQDLMMAAARKGRSSPDERRRTPRRIRRGALLSALRAATPILGRILIIAAAVIGACYLLFKVWVIVLPLILAVLLSSILWPVTKFLRRGLPAAAAAAITIVGLVGAAVGVGWATAALSVNGVRELSTRTKDNVRSLNEFAASLWFTEADINEFLESALIWPQENLGQILVQLFTGLETVGSITVTVLLTLILTFFCLKDGDGFSEWLLRWTTGTAPGR